MSGIKRWMDAMDNAPRTGSQSVITAEMQLKINSLKSMLYGLLSNNKMTPEELVKCLMSEPYSLSPQDLDLVTIALNKLSEADLLMVTFRTNMGDLTVEPVFRATLRKHRP